MNKLDTVLLVSDSQQHRQLLRSVLAESYHTLEATNASQALLLWQQNISCIAAVIADISSDHHINDAFADIRDHSPLILICREDSPQILNHGFSFGAADVIPLDYDPDAMLHRIDTITHLHNHKLYLERMVDEQAQKLRHSNDTMVGALSSIIEYRSVESGQHILRIRHFTKVLLEEVRRCCPEYRLTDEIISVITSASALHDIGKIAIPDAILLKPGRLTDEERTVMQTHALTGCQILESLQDMGNQEYLRYAHNICHYHHERWDGKGYPEGLKEDAIPICAQVVGLADVYDALTSKRVYKDAFTSDTAVNMILNGECGTFSPKLLECFKHVHARFHELALSYADGLSPNTETFDVTLPEPATEESQDTLNRVQGKYLSLMHYLNCFLLELSIDQKHYHLRYNPYPELSVISQARDLKEMKQLILNQLVIPEDRPDMEQLFCRDIPAFLEDGLRRQSFRFHFRGKDGTGELYDLTLLRSNTVQSTNRTLSVLCRKLTDQETIEASSGCKTTVSSLIGYTVYCRNDREFTLLQLGEDIPTLIGYTPDEIRLQFGGKLSRMIHPEDCGRVSAAIAEQLQAGDTALLECRLLHKCGQIRWISCKITRVQDPCGEECLLIAIADVTHMRDAYDALQQKLDRYEVILAQTENVLFDWDVRTDTVSFSDTWKKILGSAPIAGNVRSTLAGSSFLHPDDVPLLMDAIDNLERGSSYEMAEARIAVQGGRYSWCRFRASARRNKNGNLEKVYGIIINIDSEKQAEQNLQERAERDALTKLLNKQTTRKQIEEYLSHYPNGIHCAMLIIDLDNFKEVNDRFGHLFGDSVLTHTARIIRKMFRMQDVIGRIGGDEFLVLMRGISNPRLAEDRCHRLIAEVCRFAQNQKQPLKISCSIGIAMSPDHGTNYFELFQHADQALYQAKAQGKGTFVMYSPQNALIAGPGRQPTAVNNRIDSDSEPGLANNSLVQYAFYQLYSSQNVSSAVNDLLSVVGKKLNVSRVYVFENSDDNRFCSNTYEWCNDGIEPQMDLLQNISYEEEIPNYEENFNEEGIFYCPDINYLPRHLYDIVAPQGIKSMLHCAMLERGVFRGYIGFDECVTPRMWTREQIEMLSYFSNMLSVFLLKKREQEKVIRSADELRTVLENQNAWIYVIDPDTFRIKYLNKKSRNMPNAPTTGMYCYNAIMGTDFPCSKCPARDIRQKKNNAILMHNPVYNIDALADASLIRWNGEDACLLTCRQIPKENS